MGEITEHSRASWLRGMGLVVIVALIWIAASYLVQAVEDDGLPPFILTYICNSLFVIYIPIVEFGWWREKRGSTASIMQSVKESFRTGFFKKLPEALDYMLLPKSQAGDTIPLVSRHSSECDPGAFKGEGQFKYRMESVPRSKLVEDPYGHGMVAQREEIPVVPTTTEGSSVDSPQHLDSSKPPRNSSTSTQKHSQNQEDPRPTSATDSTVVPHQEKAAVLGIVDDSSPIKGVVEIDNNSSSNTVTKGEAERRLSVEGLIEPTADTEEDTDSLLTPAGINRGSDSPEDVTRHPSFSYWVSTQGKHAQAQGFLEASSAGYQIPVEVPGVSQGQVKVIDVVDNSSADLTLENGQLWTRARIASVSLLICPFWFLAQLTFNVSLSYTSVSSNTILSSTASLFTFILSVAFLGEKFTATKLISILLVICGTGVVSIADGNQDDSPGSTLTGAVTNTLAGDLLCLCSAFFYAVYTSLLRKCAPEEMVDDLSGEGLKQTDGQRSLTSTSRGASSVEREYSNCSERQRHGGLATIMEEGNSSEGSKGYSCHSESSMLGRSSSAATSQEKEIEESVNVTGDGPDSVALMHGHSLSHVSSQQQTKNKLQLPLGGSTPQGVVSASEAERGKEGKRRACLPSCCEYSVPYSTALMFGYLGVFNALLMLPLLFFLPTKRTWPTLTQWGLVVTKGLFDNVLSDYLWALAVLLTTPTAATLGLQIQIPISLVVDSFLERSLPDLMHIGGATLVLLGFLGINSFVDFDWMCDCSRIFSRPEQAEPS